MNDLISEFFYEGIRRIIPGLAMIALYYHKEVANVFEAHHDYFFVMLNIGVVVIAWILGLAVEKIMAFSMAILWKFGGEWLLRKIRGWSRKLPPKPVPDNKEHKRELRRQGYLDFAEKTMCRSLWAVFLIPYIPYLPPAESFSNFPNVNPHSICWILGLVFFVSWIWTVWNDQQLIGEKT